MSGPRRAGGTALPHLPGIRKDAKSGQAADPTALPTKDSSGHPLVGSGLITQLKYQDEQLLSFFLCSGSAELLALRAAPELRVPGAGPAGLDGRGEQAVCRDAGGL